MIAWTEGASEHRLHAELQRDSLCLIELQERDGEPGPVSVIVLPAVLLEQLETECARLRAERDRAPGQLVLFPERRAAA